MKLSYEDRYNKIPPTIANITNPLNQESRFELRSSVKKPNSNKKNPAKYCIDSEVVINSVMCNNCEHKFCCLAYFSSFEIIAIRKSFCYQDSEPKNESHIYESLINLLIKHQVKNYESLSHDKVSDLILFLSSQFLIQ